MSSYVFDVGARPRVEFRVQAGRIDCSTGEPGVVRLEIGGRGADDVVVDQQGDSIVVREERQGWIRSGSVRITGVLPVGTDVELAGASTDMHLDGVVGNLEVKTASGDVWFGGAERLEVKTASGDVRGGRVGEAALITSASGDAHLEEIGGDLVAKLASGDVNARIVHGDINVQSASGDVRVERCEGDEIMMKSVSGDLFLCLPKGIRLDANFNSLSGSIHLPEKRSESTNGDRRRVKMDAKTVSGDIRIDTYTG